MSADHEHDDDLEPEVIEGAEIETEQYEAPEDEEGILPGTDPTHLSDRPSEVGIPAAADVEKPDEASDTI
jgi:hypothetical protein